MVTGFEPLIDTLTLPDPNDRHLRLIDDPSTPGAAHRNRSNEGRQLWPRSRGAAPADRLRGGRGASPPSLHRPDIVPISSRGCRIPLLQRQHKIGRAHV
jgi:hypothetical protein